MPRPERPLDPGAGPVERFAADLRGLRSDAGSPTYRELAVRANYSATVLADAAGGTRLPTLAVALAYAQACGADRAEWERRWRAAAAACQRREPRDPAELPPTIDTFVGRESELSWLQHQLDHAGSIPQALRIAVVHGIGGVGKSALAVRAAHRLADRFPDGQLFADLHGYADAVAPLDPLEVLGRFIRALGLPDRDVPATTDEAAARYRSLLARRSALVVLDNVRDSAQVRPLLPGNTACAVLITSRVPLADLDGVGRLHVDVFTPREAIALLGRLAGRQRLVAEPEAAGRLARASGFLPLALRITGARLAVRPTLTVRALADRLADAQRRLDELHVGDLAVRASFQLSYQSLNDSAARAYRLLSLLDGPDFGAHVAAAQLDELLPGTENVLERLVNEGLLREPAPGRYQYHDLLRLFAREMAAGDDPAERLAALDRVIRCYLATARRAAELLAPGFPHADDGVVSTVVADLSTKQDALTWLEAERTGIMAAASQAVAAGAPSAVLLPDLAACLHRFFRVRGHWRDWETLDRLAIDMARRADNHAAEARLLDQLGVVYTEVFRLDAALESLTESLKIFRELDDRAGEAWASNHMGTAYATGRRFEEAVACLERSLTLQRECGDRAGEGSTLNALGVIHRETGRLGEAESCFELSLPIWGELGDAHSEGIVLSNLGHTLLAAGRTEQAIACYEKDLAIVREFGDRNGEAFTLLSIGEAYRLAGRLDDAVATCEQGLALEREVAHRWGEGHALHYLGKALHDLGHRQEARARWEEAVRCFQEIGAPDSADVLAHLAELTRVDHGTRGARHADDKEP